MLTLCAGLISRMNKYKLAAVACCAKATFELTEEKRRYAAAGRRRFKETNLHYIQPTSTKLTGYDVMAAGP